MWVDRGVVVTEPGLVFLPLGWRLGSGSPSLGGMCGNLRWLMRCYCCCIPTQLLMSPVFMVVMKVLCRVSGGGVERVYEGEFPAQNGGYSKNVRTSLVPLEDWTHGCRILP